MELNETITAIQCCEFNKKKTSYVSVDGSGTDPVDDDPITGDAYPTVSGSNTDLKNVM